MFLLKSKVIWILLIAVVGATAATLADWNIQTDITIALALLGVMIYSAIRMAILTAKQTIQLGLFLMAFGLLLTHFALGVPWEQIPSHMAQVIEQLPDPAALLPQSFKCSI